MPERKERHPIVPNDLAHPAPEDLAAYAAGEAGEAGDLDRAGIAGHLAGCPSCAAEAEAIEAVPGDLAELDEPELPPGFHDRLMAAVQAELDDPQPVPDQADAEADAGADAGASVTDLGVARRRRRLPGRPLTWGAVAAAALLVAVISVTQLEDRSSSDSGATVAAPAPQAGTPAPVAGGGNVPIFSLPGELNLDQLRSAVGSQRALGDAFRSAGGSDTADRSGTAAPAPAQAQAQAQAQVDEFSKASGGLGQCLAAAGPDARPAFFVQGTYQRRPATILVTVEAQGRIGVYVFGRDDCTTLLRHDSAAPPPTTAP